MIKKIVEKRKLILIGLLILLNCGYFFTAGRYAYTEIKKYFIRTNRFYFNCDKLSESGSNIEMTNWSGVGQYTVVFNMNNSSNRLLSSEENIEYDITYRCSSNVTCSIEDNKTNGTITTTTNTDSFTIVITVPPDVVLQDMDVVELYVETNATTPYQKKLYGTVRLVVGHYGLSYEIEDSVNSPYLSIKNTNTLDYYVVKTAFGNYTAGAQIDTATYQSLTAAEKQNCASAIITLEFDPNVILLDMTNEFYQNAFDIQTVRINNYDYIKKFSFKIEAMSSNNIKFYKKNVSNNYSYPNGNASSIITVTYS